MPFFDFGQNNSGGSFYMSDTVAHHVIIEAPTASLANVIAEEKGLYFDGVSSGNDCPCCGDRWYAQWDEKDGEATPTIYGQPASEYNCRWTPEGQPFCIIYYLDGKVERLYAKAK